MAPPGILARGVGPGQQTHGRPSYAFPYLPAVFPMRFFGKIDD